VAQWIRHWPTEPGTVGSSPTKVMQSALARRVIINISNVIFIITMALARACRLRARAAVHRLSPAAELRPLGAIAQVLLLRLLLLRLLLRLLLSLPLTAGHSTWSA